jgi:uncharacterized protein
LAKTLVVGASLKPERYSNRAVNSLLRHGHEVLALGNRQGFIGPVEIQKGTPAFSGVDTITLYLSAINQAPIQDYLLSLKPRRIIFNPGAENPELEKLAAAQGVLVEEACTLVMLSTDQY